MPVQPVEKLPVTGDLSAGVDFRVAADDDGGAAGIAHTRQRVGDHDVIERRALHAVVFGDGFYCFRFEPAQPVLEVVPEIERVVEVGLTAEGFEVAVGGWDGGWAFLRFAGWCVGFHVANMAFYCMNLQGNAGNYFFLEGYCTK